MKLTAFTAAAMNAICPKSCRYKRDFSTPDLYGLAKSDGQCCGVEAQIRLANKKKLDKNC